VNSDYNVFVDLLKRLHVLMAADQGDEKAADDLRDEMDGLWNKLSDEEQLQLHVLSAELYEDSGVPVTNPFDVEFQTKIQKAIEFATMAHVGQTRKGNGLPYICHPIGVLNQIADWGCCDVNVWLAAICHDVAEDTHCNIDDIEKVIGYDATKIVEELTFRPKSDNDHDKAVEKQQYIDQWSLKKEDGTWEKSTQSFIIKVADRIMNTRDFIKTDPKYAAKYWDKAKSLTEATDRREEIVAIYGQNVWRKMFYSKVEMPMILLENKCGV